MLIVTFPILQELNIPEVLDNVFACDKVCVCDCEGELSWISEKSHSISCRYGWSAWLSSENRRNKYNLEWWPETTKKHIYHTIMLLPFVLHVGVRSFLTKYRSFTGWYVVPHINHKIFLLLFCFCFVCLVFFVCLFVFLLFLL